ncbi:MAG: hypothetical protein ACE5EU_04965 [Paracoccaceae bacterium]
MAGRTWFKRPWPAITRPWDKNIIGALAAGLLAFCFLANSTSSAQETGESAPVAGKELDGIILRILPQSSTPDDGFWDWFVGYTRALAEYERRTNEIRFDLSVLAKDAAEKRAHWMRLFRTEYVSRGMVLGDPGFFDIELEKHPHLIEFFFGDLDGSIGGHGAVAERLRHARDVLGDEIGGIKDSQNGLIERALSLHRRLIAKLEVRIGLVDRPRRFTREQLENLQNERDFLEIELYDAAEWYREDELPRLIEAMNPKANARPQALSYIEAKMKLAEADNLERKLWFQQLDWRAREADAAAANPNLSRQLTESRLKRAGALKSLREFVRYNPTHEKARAELREQELYWLRMVSAKLLREKTLNLAAFGAYLDGHGFYAGEPEGLWEGIAEVWSTYFGMGPVSLTGGLPAFDVPGANADLVDQVQTATAKHVISLNAIIRLVKNGIPLPGIQGISVGELSEKVVLRRVDSRAMALDKAALLLEDIKATISELPDLKRLASDDPFFFEEDVSEAFAASYFDTIDSDYHPWELFGDIFSVRNLLTIWGPNAITKVKVGERWWWAAPGDDVAAAVVEGQTVGRRLFPGMRLDRLAESFSRTGYGQSLLRAHALDQQYLGRLSAATRAAFESGTGTGYLKAAVFGSLYGSYRATEFAAVIGVMISAHLAAEASGIPGAVFLVNLIDAFEAHEYFWVVVKQSGAPLNRILARVDALERAVADERRAIAALNDVFDQIESGRVPAPTRRMAAGGASPTASAPSPAARPAAGAALPTTGVRPAPGKIRTGSEAAEEAAEQAGAAARRGDMAEARRAARAGKELAEEVSGQLDELQMRIARTRRRLASDPDLAYDVDEAPSARPIFEDPDKRYRYFFDDEFYGDGSEAGGVILRQGDALLAADDLDGALETYQIARRIELDEARPNMDRVKYLKERMALVARARAARLDYHAKRAASPHLPAKDPIAKEEADDFHQAILDFNNQAPGAEGPVKITFFGSGNNNIYKIELADGRAMLVKPLESRQAVKRELYGAAVFNEMGLNAPASRNFSGRGESFSVPHPDGKSMLTADLDNAVLMRPIDGVRGELFELGEHDLLALRADMARARAARASIGDADGHLSNSLVDEHGNFWSIDFDRASLKPNQHRLMLDADFASTADAIEGSVAMVHGRLRGRMSDPGFQQYYGDMVAGFIKNRTHLMHMSRYDQLLRLEDMVDQFNRISNYSASGLRTRLSQAGFDDTEIDDLIRLFGERAPHVGPVLSKPALFGSGPIKLRPDDFKQPPAPDAVPVDRTSGKRLPAVPVNQTDTIMPFPRRGKGSVFSASIRRAA